MAVTQNNYTGDGSTVLYSFTFPYLATTDVKVKLDGVDTTAYSFANATTVQMNSAPANGAKVIIYRNTNNDNKKATFYPGSAIKAEDLNNNYDQILYVAQEVDNNAMSTLGDTAMQGDFLMGPGFGLQFEGSTEDANETRLVAADPTADRTITLPNVTGNVVTTGDTGTVTDAMLSGGTALTSAEKTKLAGIEAGATGDQTNAEIRTAVEAASDSNVFTDADHSKLNSIEANATADQTAAEIRTLVESATDSNVFTDADHSKLNAIEASATADQTAAEIRTLVDSATDSNVFTDADHTKLDSIATGAEVNVQSDWNSGSGDSQILNKPTVAGGATGLDLNDNVKAKFGTGSDLQLYHDGTNSHLNNTTGYLVVGTDSYALKDQSLNEFYIKALKDGAVELYYNNAKKFETHQYGVDISGNVYIGDSGEGKLLIGAGEDLQIYHDGSNTFFANLGTGSVVHRIQNGDIHFQYYDGSSAEEMAVLKKNGAVELFYDGSKKFETNSAGVKVTGQIEADELYLRDSEKAYFGTGTDLQIYHDGSHSVLKNITGSLYAATGAFLVQNAAQTESQIISSENGSVQLFYDNSKKFETTSAGATVTGTLTATAFSGDGTNITGITSTPGSNHDIDLDDNKKFICGDGDDLQIYHDGTDSYLTNATNELIFKTGSNFDFQVNNSENAIKATANGSVELYYDNTKKFETTGGGISIVGTIEASGNLDVPDWGQLKLGTGDDLLIYHNGTDSYFKNTTNDLYIQNTGDDTYIIATDDIYLKNGDDWAIKCIGDGAVELYYDNSKKFETTTNGPAVSSGGTDDSKLYFLTSGHTTTRIGYVGLTRFGMDVNGGLEIRDAGNSYETMFKTVSNGATELYYDNSKKLDTTSTGITVQGRVFPQGGNLYLADSSAGGNGRATFGGGEDLQIYHNGTDSYIENTTGYLYLDSGASAIRLISDSSWADGSMAAFYRNGAVELYYDNSKKLETEASGVKVSNGRFYSAGTFAYIESSDTSNTTLTLKKSAGGADSIDYLQLRDSSNNLKLAISGSGDIDIEDNAKLKLGTGDDLLIWHDGTDSIIRNTTGDLYIQNSASDIEIAAEDNVYIKNYDGQTYARFMEDGASELYYDNTKRFETGPGYNLSTGDISPSASGTYNLGGTSAKWNNAYFAGNVYLYDNDKLILGDGSDLEIRHNGNNSYIKNSTGWLTVNAANFSIDNAANNESLATFVENGAVSLYYDNSKKFETYSSGVIVSSGNLLAGRATGQEGSGGEVGLQLSADSKYAMFVRSGATTAYLGRNTDNGTIVQFLDDGSSVGSISTNGNSLPSDRNYKKNISNLTLGLNLIEKLKPVSYNYKFENDSDPVKYGLIAQDLEQSLEEVGVEKDSAAILQYTEEAENDPNINNDQSKYNLSYEKLIPILINAVKELSTKVAALESS